MTAFEVASIAAIVLVGVIATVAICLGLMNWFGGFHMVHCRNCHHLTGSTTDQPQASCPQCRHPMVFHPLYAMQHRASPVRVRPDPLRY